MTNWIYLPVDAGLRNKLRELDIGPLDHEIAGEVAASLRRFVTRLASRNIALMLIMRDLLARRSEATALTIQDQTFAEDGSATSLIARSSTGNGFTPFQSGVKQPTH